MTIPIDLELVYDTIKEMRQDETGWVPLQTLLDRIAESYACTVLTARNFLNRHSEFFEFKRGSIRFKTLQTLESQSKDLSDFKSWLSSREAVLDECLEFLKVQTPSPYIENLLVQAGSVRDEFRSFSDLKLSVFLMKLKQEFNYTPIKSLEVEIK